MYLDNKVSQQEIIRYKRAQIMLITLLVLILLGIIISAIVLVLRRDTDQIVATEKYEELYNSAELNLLDVVSVYGTSAQPLSGLTTDFPGTCIETATTTYNCTFDSTDATSFESLTEIESEDTNEFEGYEISKDESFAMQLNNYRSTLQFEWNNTAAIELTLFYRDAPGAEVQAVKGVYNRTGVLDAPAVSAGAFNFVEIPGSDRDRSFQISLNNVQPGGILESLYVTPRMSGDFGGIELDVTPTDPSTFPPQIRQFTASSYDPDDGASPVVRLQIQLPLTPQTNSVLDYALLTDDAISF